MDMPIPATPISPLRQRLIDDMNMRRFSRETQRNYIRDDGRFASFLGRPPDTATAEDLRRFQVDQREAGVPVPTMNSIVFAGVRIHDLRHSFAIHAAGMSETLPMIGKLLGHAKIASTARYAHLDDGAVLEAEEGSGTSY